MASHCPQGRKCLALPVSSKIFAKPFKYFATHHCPSSQAIYLPLHAAWPLSFLWGLCQYCLYAWHLPSHAHRSSVGVLSNSCDSSIDRLDQHYSCRVSVCSKLARTNRKLDVYDHPPSSILHPLHKFVDLWGCFFLHQPPPKKQKAQFFVDNAWESKGNYQIESFVVSANQLASGSPNASFIVIPKESPGVPLRCAATRILDPSERLWRLAIPSDSSPVALRRWYAQMATRRSFCWGLEKVGTVGWDCLKTRNFGVGRSVGIVANY